MHQFRAYEWMKLRLWRVSFIHDTLMNKDVDMDEWNKFICWWWTRLELSSPLFHDWDCGGRLKLSHSHADVREISVIQSLIVVKFDLANQASDTWIWKLINWEQKINEFLFFIFSNYIHGAGCDRSRQTEEIKSKIKVNEKRNAKTKGEMGKGGKKRQFVCKTDPPSAPLETSTDCNSDRIAYRWISTTHEQNEKKKKNKRGKIGKAERRDSGQSSIAGRSSRVCVLCEKASLFPRTTKPYLPE